MATSCKIDVLIIAMLSVYNTQPLSLSLQCPKLETQNGLIGIHYHRAVGKSKQEAEKLASISNMELETNKEHKYDQGRYVNNETETLAEDLAKYSVPERSSTSLDEDSNVTAVEVCRYANIHTTPYAPLYYRNMIHGLGLIMIFCNVQ